MRSRQCRCVVAVALTLYSGLDYLVRARALAGVAR